MEEASRLCGDGIGYFWVAMAEVTNADTDAEVEVFVVLIVPDVGAFTFGEECLGGVSSENVFFLLFFNLLVIHVFIQIMCDKIFSYLNLAFSLMLRLLEESKIRD